MTKFKYPLAKKCYWAGSKEDLKQLWHPECGAVQVWISNGEKVSIAKKKGYKELKYNDDIESYIDVNVIRDKFNDSYLCPDGKSRTKNLIHQHEQTEKYKANLADTLFNHKGKNCYIYSGQWSMYWRANSAGYTNDIREVGTYTIEEAVKIAYGCGIEKQLEIQVI